MKLPISTLILLLFSGCVVLSPKDDDSFEPFSKRILWRHAQLLLEGTNTYPGPTVASGSNIVLEICRGWRPRNNVTTGHPSHDTVYLLLPGEPRPGDHFHCSYTNRTLAFHGFAGYWYSTLDTNASASAEVEVESVGRTTVRLKCAVALDYRREIDSPGERGRHFTLSETGTFRQSVPIRR